MFLATAAIRQRSPRITFNSAAEMLAAFGLQQGGSQYRRLVGSFQRIFGATIFFGTDTQLERATVVHQARFNFMTEAGGRHRVPLFGRFGLVSQLGSVQYARPRKFREKLQGWLDLARAMWPECPVWIDDEGTGLWVDRAIAVRRRG